MLPYHQLKEQNQNQQKFKSLESYKQKGIYFLGQYQKKFTKLGYSEEQLYNLWKSISHTKELNKIYKTEKERLKQNGTLKDINNKVENNFHDIDVIEEGKKNEQKPTSSYKNNSNINKDSPKKVQCEFNIKNSEKKEEQIQNEFDEKNHQQNKEALKIRFSIDLTTLLNENLTPKEKTKLILKEIKQKLQLYFKELKLDDKISKLQQKSGKNNQNQLQSVLRQKDIISQHINEIIFGRNKQEEQNNENQQIQKQQEELIIEDFGKIRKCGKQIQYQGDIRDKNLWKTIIRNQKAINKDLMFTGIIMDPPWNDTALNLKYDTLKNEQWMDDIPLDKLQKVGYLFLWITNHQLENAILYLQKQNYARVDMIIWVKIDEDNQVQDGIGYYVRHSYEMCLVAQKQQNLELLKILHKTHTAPGTIVHKRQEQSRKPVEIYQIMEILMPNGYYLDIFGRKYNQRDGWITVGNESIELKIIEDKKNSDEMKEK